MDQTFEKRKKIIYEDFGEMIFTHFGISGPTILSGSAHLVKYKEIDYLLRNKYITVSIDLKPALSEDQLDDRILRDFKEFKNKQYFDIEFVDWGTDYQDGMGIVTYKIDGVEKTLEWHHEGIVISLENIEIAADRIYKYVFADNAEYIEEAIDLATEELLKGDY